MRGCIKQRGNTWTYWVDTGREPVTGKRKQKTKGGFPSKKAAQAALNEVLGQVQQGTYLEPAKQTVTEYLREWLPSVRHSIRRTTWDLYCAEAEAYVIPHIGQLKLPQLSHLTINRLYSNLLESGGRGGKPLSVSTVRNVHVMLRRALRDAPLAVNPATKAVPPKKDRTEMQTWTAAEVRCFLEYVRTSAGASSQHYTAYLLAVSTGMRRSELLGLRWSDVDLDRGTLTINQVATAYSTKNATEYTAPKTPKSHRTIPLDAPTLKALRAWRVERFSISNHLVFTEGNGDPIPPAVFAARFRRVVKASGLRPIRFHDLRHTHATLALMAGIQTKVVQERLGHASIQVTSDVYQHVLPGVQEEAVSKISALLWEGRA